MKYGVSSRARNEPLQRLTILSVTQFNVHLPWQIDSYENITTVTHKQLSIEVHVHAQKSL